MARLIVSEFVTVDGVMEDPSWTNSTVIAFDEIGGLKAHVVTLTYEPV